jgi:hypothetical protein
MACFENSLIISLDFIQPRARKGKKEPENLVTACRPCNRIKGSRVFASFEGPALNSLHLTLSDLHLSLAGLKQNVLPTYEGDAKQ